MTVRVDAPHEGGAVVVGPDLPGVRRNEADRQSDAAVSGAIGVRCVGNAEGEDRAFPRIKLDIHGLGFIDAFRDFLATREHVVVVVRLLVGEVRAQVRAQQVAHAAAGHVGG